MRRAFYWWCIGGPYEQGQATAALGFEYHPEAAVPYAITRYVDKDADGSPKNNSGTIAIPSSSPMV